VRDPLARFLPILPADDLYGDGRIGKIFDRVFAVLDPQAFERHFLEWVQRIAQVTKGQVVAVDGKALRRSQDLAAGHQAIHMVSAWASESGLTLGQVSVGDKSSEITAVPELLQLLELSG